MTITPATKLTVLKLLAAGNTAEFVASAVPEANLTPAAVKHVGAEHGYPDRSKLRWAVDILEKQQARVGLTVGALSRPAVKPLTHKPAPVSKEPAVDLKPPADDPSPVETSPPAFDELFSQARESAKTRTRNLGVKIEGLVDELRARLDAEAEEQRQAAEREAERAAAIEEVRQLEEQLEAARAKLRKHKNHDGGNGRARVTRSPSPSSRKPGGQAAQEKHDYPVAEVRAWARDNGVECPARGRFLPRDVVDAWKAATS